MLERWLVINHAPLGLEQIKSIIIKANIEIKICQINQSKIFFCNIVFM